MTGVSTKVFIAYDFAIEGTLPDSLSRVASAPPPGFTVDWPGSPDSKSQGEIWRDKVRPGIEGCNRFLAFLDLPNANVGFEVGYALGLGKEVALARVADELPAWTREPPLDGFLCTQMDTPAAIRKAIGGEHWRLLGERPRAGKDVLVLCPRRTGASYLEEIDPAWGWRQPDETDRSLHGLPHQLEGIGLVPWVIAPHNEGAAGRDGEENAALSVIAGYAEALPGVEVRVLAHKNARRVADIVARRTEFPGVASFAEVASGVVEGWRKEVERRAAAATPERDAETDAILRPLRPRDFRPHPVDTWREDLGSRFIGRERLLIDATEAARGMRHRFAEHREAPGSQGVKLIWVHGFGGMGKSWFLHRARLQAADTVPGLQTLFVDFDARPSNAWRQPLSDLPRHAEDLYEPIAWRLAQRLGLEAVDPYWLAKARVRGAAEKHHQLRTRFDHHLELAHTAEADRVQPHLRGLLADACGGPRLWEMTEKERSRRLRLWSEDPDALDGVFAAWCHDAGVFDEAAIEPDRELARGLRQALRDALAEQPLLLMLDSAELLTPALQRWLRRLLVGLLVEPLPLLMLVGSRLRPDSDQSPGSRRGWLAEVPERFRRVDAFAELLRFTPAEIEEALGRLVRPAPGDRGHLAEQLHRVTLGVPLPLRTLLDIHEQGGSALAELGALEPGEAALRESDAVRRVIAVAAERLLLHLAAQPTREDDYCAITTLAILPAADHLVLCGAWGEDPHARLLDLGSRYSLLADGDLHPTVRQTLRRYWRDPAVRPRFFPATLDSLERAVNDLPAREPLSRDPARFRRLGYEANLRAWRQVGGALDFIARALCLAAAYEVEPSTLVELLGELPLLGDEHAAARELWQSEPVSDPDDRDSVKWLAARRKAAGGWTAEEEAALALLEGIAASGWGVTPGTALAALERLEIAVGFFGLESMPKRGEAGEAFFRYGCSLQDRDRGGSSSPDRCELAYRRAVALGSNESIAENNLGVLYDNLGRLLDAEVSFQRSIELDPKNAYPHTGLGNVLCDLRSLVEAEASYRRSIELDPKYAHPHTGLGNVFYYLRNLVEAEASYRRSIELNPKYADPHSGLGNVFCDLRNLMDAEASYRRSIELNPKYAHPHNGLGNVLHDLGNLAEAEASYRRAIELNPKYAHPHTGLGNVLHDLGNLAEAEASYRRAIELNPKYAHPHHALGNVFYDLGNLAEAEASYRRAIELNPKYAHPHHALGNVLHELGNLAEAKASYRRAIERDPKYAPPHIGLACLREDTGSEAETAALFEAALALEGLKSAGSERGLCWVALRREDFVDGRRWAQAAMAKEPDHPGSSLAAAAATVWELGWSAGRENFQEWVEQRGLRCPWFAWTSRNRLAALLRRVRAEGGLGDVAAILRSAAARPATPWWQPWSEAIDAALAGSDDTLADARARELYRLLVVPASLGRSR